jgi:hypothetical protein
MNDTVLKATSYILGLIIVATIFGAVLSYPVMLLWNGCLAPAINGINQITWLQAWGLMVLSSLLIKSSTTVTSKG